MCLNLNFFGGAVVLKSGPPLARQEFYHLSQAPAHFALVIFWTGSYFFFPQVGLDRDSIYASYIAGVIGVHYHTQLDDRYFMY
jgi:hypothetical protein